MGTRSFLQIILIFVVLLDVPISRAAVERPKGWRDDGIYKGEDHFSSGLRCYDCLDCDEPFSHEYRNCFSAISCHIVRAKLKINGFSEWAFYKARLSTKDYAIWYKNWYKRKLTIRGCSDYGFNCTELKEKHKTEGNFKAPFHMVKILKCEECVDDLCNNRKTEDHPMVDRAAVLGSSKATTIYAQVYINSALILYGIVKIIHALWFV